MLTLRFALSGDNLPEVVILDCKPKGRGLIYISYQSRRNRDQKGEEVLVRFVADAEQNFGSVDLAYGVNKLSLVCNRN